MDKQFGSKSDKIYCGNCYDSQFASRCDGCGEVFRAGEYFRLIILPIRFGGHLLIRVSSSFLCPVRIFVVHLVCGTLIDRPSQSEYMVKASRQCMTI